MASSHIGRTKLSQVALVVVFTDFLCLLIKVGGGLITSSVSILADAADSFLDFSAALFAFWALRQAALPPDKEHPFGHGKYESLSSLIQGSFIIGTALVILWEAVGRLIGKGEVRLAEVGIGVMVLNMGYKVIITSYLNKKARLHNSLALFATAQMHSSDLYNSLGVLSGLILIRLFHIHLIDPIIAILVSAFIFWKGIGILKEAVAQVVDKAPPEVEEKIHQLLEEHYPLISGFHKVRVRRVGAELQVDMHLLMPPRLSLEEAHDLSEHIESDIKNLYPSTTVVIHMEPHQGISKDEQDLLESKDTK